MVFVVVSCLHLVVITAHVITVITHRPHGGTQRVEHDTNSARPRWATDALHLARRHSMIRVDMSLLHGPTRHSQEEGVQRG